MILRFLLLACLVPGLVAPNPARAQQGGHAATEVAPGLTPAEAQRALDALQDPQKRAELLGTLQAIAKASAPGPAAAGEAGPGEAAKPGAEKPAVTLQPGSVGAQVVSRLAGWPQRLAETAIVSVRTMPDPVLFRDWVVRIADDPVERDVIFQALWRAALVFGAALLLEWLTAYALRRAAARIAARAPDPEEAAAAPEHDAWHRLRRMPFAAARLLLELIPIAVFWTAGVLLAGLAPAAIDRMATLAVVNAYATARAILAVGRMLIAPGTTGLRLLQLDDDRAASLMRWLRRIAILAVFGSAAVKLTLLFGLHPAAAATLFRVVGLLAAVLLAVMVFQLRESIAARLRAAPDGKAVAAWRGWLAPSWHYLAWLAIGTGWIAWAAEPYEAVGGLELLIASIAIVVAARLVALAANGALDRAMNKKPASTGPVPNPAVGMNARAARYAAAASLVVNAIVGIVAAFFLLQLWGADIVAWFEAGAIGSQVLSALITIGLAVATAVIVWEISNAALERRLARLSEAGPPAHAARLRTLLPILRAALLVTILVVVGLTALSEVGINIAPLLAGAGIVGVAIGFGSQKLVQDVVTGMFVLFENAIQVGDWVTVAGLSGKVERLSVRNLWLRGGDGVLHIVPFSAVGTISNTNRGLGTAAVSVTVAFSEDSDRAADAMRAIAAELREEPEFADKILEDLQLWVDSVRALGVTLSGIIPCTDAGRWPVQREFNRRLQKQFKALGIDLGLKLGDA